MKKEKIMLSILKEINDFNVPTEEDYEINARQFYSICKALEAEGYITNIEDCREYIDGDVAFSLEGAEITLSGIRYLKESKALYKGYKGLKEFRDWLTL